MVNGQFDYALTSLVAGQLEKPARAAARCLPLQRSRSVPARSTAREPGDAESSRRRE